MVFHMTLLISVFDCMVLAVLYYLFLRPRLQTGGRRHFIAASLFYSYICLVLMITLLPVIPTFDAPTVNLIPFRDYFYHFGDYERQIILNAVMFVPMGFMMPHFARSGTFRTVLYCALVSLAIELLQPWVTLGRVCDVTDLITNTAGAAVGALGYRLFRFLFHRFQKHA